MYANFLRLIGFQFVSQSVSHIFEILHIVGDPEVTANLYCNFAHLYLEGYVICSIYLR